MKIAYRSIKLTIELISSDEMHGFKIILNMMKVILDFSKLLEFVC